MVACRTPVNRDESGERPSLNGWTALAKAWKPKGADCAPAMDEALARGWRALAMDAAGGMFDDTVRNQRDIFDRAYDAGWQALARAW